MNTEEMFSIVCPKCGREAGKPCTYWEGAPAACKERADAAYENAAHNPAISIQEHDFGGENEY